MNHVSWTRLFWDNLAVSLDLQFHLFVFISSFVWQRGRGSADGDDSGGSEETSLTLNL